MTAYLTLKTIHITRATLSIAGFLLRGYWMLRGSPLLRHPLTRVLPHLNDTLLLGAAIGLVLVLHQYPLVHGWLTAKVAALLAYIALGSLALGRGRTRAWRVAALSGAVAVYAYIVAVALTRNPWPLAPG